MSMEGEISESYARVRFARWCGSDEGRRSRYRDDAAEIAPSGQFVAAVLAGEAGNEKDGGERLVLTRASNGGTASTSEIHLPGPCDVFFWVSENRLISAGVEGHRLRIRLFQAGDGRAESGSWEDSFISVDTLKCDCDEATNHKKYFINSHNKRRGYELEDCYASDCGHPVEITARSSDPSNGVCTLVVRNEDETESFVTLRSFKHWIEACPVVRIAKARTTAVRVKNDLVAAAVRPNFLYVWNLTDSHIVWRHSLSKESVPTSTFVSQVDIRFSNRDEVIFAVGADNGLFISVLRPIGSFPISIRRRRVASFQEKRLGSSAGASEGCVRVSTDSESPHTFHCVPKRIVLLAFPNHFLRHLVFHNDRVLSVHVPRDAPSGRVRLMWSDLGPQNRRALEHSRKERILDLGGAMPLRISPTCLAFSDQVSLFRILPNLQSGQYVSSRGQDLENSGSNSNSANYSWLAGLLVERSVSQVGDLIDLNGICRGRDEKVMLMLSAVWQSFNIDLLDKVAPAVLGGKSALWLSSARYLTLELIICVLRHPSLKTTAVPKVLKFIIRLIKQAHSSGEGACALQLSKYLQVLRCFTRMQLPRGTMGRPQGIPEEAQAKSREPSLPETKFDILRQGLAGDRVSESVFKLLSLGLNDLKASAHAATHMTRVRRIVNSYIVHIIQRAPIEEIRHSLSRLHLRPQSIVEEIFWAALSPSIRWRAVEILNTLRCLSEDALKVLNMMQTILDVYQGKEISLGSTFPEQIHYGTVMASFSSHSSAEKMGFSVEDLPPVARVHVDLKNCQQFEGVLGEVWPKRVTSLNLGREQDEEGASSAESATHTKDEAGEGGTGIESIPALWFADLEDETVRRLIIEGTLLAGGQSASHRFLSVVSEYWESCFRYACEHVRLDLLEQTLESIPESAKCPGQLKVRINHRGIREIPMLVFMPELPVGLSSILQNRLRQLLATRGIFQQLYWSSALDFLAFCERTILSAQSGMASEELERIHNSLKTVSAIYCSVNRLPNLALLHDRSGGATNHVEDALASPQNLSWCGWLTIAQNRALGALSCAVNTALACGMEVRTGESGSIRAIEGIGKDLRSLPLLGFEPKDGEACDYMDSAFWEGFKRNLIENAELDERHPTLASFLTEMWEIPRESDSSHAREESFVAVRNALFACSCQSAMLLSNFPPQLPQWTKKLIHLSTNVRQYSNPGAPGGGPEVAGDLSSENLRDSFLRQERDIEKYVENEFFVLPYESSLNLKIQNHLMHGRSFASIYACLKSEETQAIVEAASPWEEIKNTNDFVTLERTSYCAAISNFQDETVTAACVLTLQLLSRDTYALQLMVSVLRYVVLCVDSGLVTDAVTDGYDFLTPCVQVVCEDVKKGFVLGWESAGVRQVHEILSAILDSALRNPDASEVGSGAEPLDAKVTTWILLNAVNELCGRKRDDRYMAHLARTNDWVCFLAEAERHQYALREVMDLSKLANTEFKSHLERALITSKDAKSTALEDNEKDSSPPELFALVSESEKQALPGKYLLEACAVWRWPFLAVVSSCHDDVSKVECFQYWLGSTCVPTGVKFCPETHTIPRLVTFLCERKSYLPLVRAGETFFPKSVFVTFMYFLHSFIQIRLKDAESYLMQFKAMMKGQGSEADSSQGASWMVHAVVMALESSLASPTSNTFVRNKAIDLFHKCGVLHHFPNLRKVYVLYDILGDCEETHTNFITWRSAGPLEEMDRKNEGENDPGAPLGPFLSVDLGGATAFLERQNKFREARMLHERCGLGIEDLVLRHADRILGEPGGDLGALAEGSARASWKEIQTLFLESQLSPRLAGDFFFKQFDKGLGAAPVASNLRLLEMAFNWYSGVYTDREPCCSPEFLEGVMFRGLICRHVMGFEQMRNDSPFFSPFSSSSAEEGPMSGEKDWFIPAHKVATASAGGASIRPSFMVGSLEHETLVSYMKTCGTKGMGPGLLAMLFDAFVWYGEIAFVRKLTSKVEIEAEGLDFLEVLATLWDHHGEEELKDNESCAMSPACAERAAEILPEIQVPGGVMDAVKFCESRIRFGTGQEFARRLCFSFELSSALSGVRPNFVLRTKPENTLQLMLRQGPGLLPLAQAFVGVFSVPPGKVAEVLVRSYFKGLLIVHRDKEEEASETSFEPAYATEEFDKCAVLCRGHEQHLGHALLNIIMTKHHLPSEFEVEVIILAYQYYEAAHAMNGVDILTTLAFDRVTTYSKNSEFKAIVRLLNGLGQSRLRQHAIDRIVANDRLELLLKKRTSNDSKERTLSRRRNLRREIMSSLYHNKAGEGGEGERQRSESKTMALHHFNKTKLIAQGMVREAEDVLRSAPITKDDVAIIRASSLLSEASSLYKSIGCVRNAAAAIGQARELTMAL